MKAKRKRGRYRTIPTLAKLIDLRVHRGLHRAIIAKVRDGKSLSVIEHGYVMQWLEELWLPKHEVRALRQQRYWDSIEQLIQTFMHFAPGGRKASRSSVVARMAERLGQTPPAVEQRLKDHQTARRLRWADDPVFAEIVATSVDRAEPIKRKRR